MDEQTPTMPIEQPQPAEEPSAPIEEQQEKTPKPKKNKKPILIGVGAVAVVILLLIFNATGFLCITHSWTAADCTYPERCSKCGTQKGDINPDRHHWNEAKCTAPRTCGYCGITDGEPNPDNHWWQEATCLEARTCGWCLKTEGEPLGHQWLESGSCKECGVMKEGASEETDDASDNASESSNSNTQQASSSQTNSSNTSFSSSSKSYVSNGKFTFSANTFENEFESSSSRVKGYDIYPKTVRDGDKDFYAKDNYLFCELQDKNDNYSTIGMMSFLIGSDQYVLYSQEFESNLFDGILFLIEDASDVSAVLFTTILAIDPALDYSEAADFGQSVVDNAGSSEGVTKNGINYVILQDGGYHYLKVSVA